MLGTPHARVKVRDKSNPIHISTLQVANRSISYCGLPWSERISRWIRVAGRAWNREDAFEFWKVAPLEFRKRSQQLLGVRFQLTKQAKDLAKMSQLEKGEREAVLVVKSVPHELWLMILGYMGREF